jgi:hypothetical protein
MLWKTILDNWMNGNILKYPKSIKNRFFYETSAIINENSIYKQKFIENNALQNITQDFSNFSEYINKSTNKYVTSFINLSGDTLLIIPMPHKNKNFTTLKDFIDNANLTQQQHFWQKVAIEIRKLIINNNKKFWVSTHGLGVNYLHVRICSQPKYYQTKQFITN